MRLVLSILLFCSFMKLPFSQSESDNYRMNRWLNYYSLKIESFTDTINQGESNLYTYESCEYDESNYIYRSFFIYSPDSSFFIDMDSYSLALETDSAGNLKSLGFDVDMEVALIDRNKKLRHRVFFCGPACTFEEAVWIDNDTFSIFGFEEDMPTIYTYRISSNEYTITRSKAEISKKANSYLTKVRLEKVKFEF